VPKQHVPPSGSGPSMFATTTSSPIDSDHVEAKLPCSNSLLFALDGLAMNLKKGYGRRRRLPPGRYVG
jgi:hypothetical protein